MKYVEIVSLDVFSLSVFKYMALTVFVCGARLSGHRLTRP